MVKSSIWQDVTYFIKLLCQKEKRSNVFPKLRCENVEHIDEIT